MPCVLHRVKRINGTVPYFDSLKGNVVLLCVIEKNEAEYANSLSLMSFGRYKN